MVGRLDTQEPHPDKLLGRIADLEREVRELKGEAFLGEARDTYKSVLEYSPVPLWIDRDNAILFVNSAALHLFGAKSPDELVGRSPLDFIEADFHALVEARRRHITQLGRSVPAVEERIVRLDGSIVEVEVTTRAFPFEGGTAVIANFVDLTERKRWEDAIRVSRERLDLVLSSVSLGVWYCDLPFDKLHWNARCKQHFGLADDAEVTIHTFYNHLHQDDRERTRQAIDRAITDRETYDVQYRTVGSDGVERWIRAIGRGFYDAHGAPVRFDGVTVDITEQKRIEEGYRELLKREASARNTAEMLNRVGPLLAAELDTSKLVQAATDIATAVTGAEYGAFFYNRRDEKGESYMLFTLSGAPHEKFARFPMPRVTGIFGPTFRGEGIIRLDDVRNDPRFGNNPPFKGPPAGHLPVVSYLAVPVISRSSEVLGGLFFAHSLPGMFTAEHERMAAGISAQAAIAIDNARLFEQANNERDKAEAAQQALRATNAELQQFAYVASHDLQEPLRTISSFTQLMEKRLAGKIDDEVREFMGYVVTGAQRMSDVIQDLLAYSRLQNSVPAQASPVDMNQAVEQAIASLRASIRESGAEITADNLPKACGDEVQFVQLLQNLIGNAIKYRSQAPPRIHISSRRVGEYVVVAVRDNGIGIDPMYHERIFGIFKRLHGNDVPGTGIGLAICKRIVERHGGRMWVESEAGHGATFYFTVPAA